LIDSENKFSITLFQPYFRGFLGFDKSNLHYPFGRTVQGRDSVNESIPGIFGVGESLGVAEVDGEIVDIGLFGNADAVKQKRGKRVGFTASDTVSSDMVPLAYAC